MKEHPAASHASENGPLETEETMVVVLQKRAMAHRTSLLSSRHGQSLIPPFMYQQRSQRNAQSLAGLGRVYRDTMYRRFLQENHHFPFLQLLKHHLAVGDLDHENMNIYGHLQEAYPAAFLSVATYSHEDTPTQYP